MTRFPRWLKLVVGLAFLPIVSPACTEEEIDPCDPTRAVTLTVTYSGDSTDLSLAQLTGTRDGDLCLVPLADVVNAAGLGIDLEATYYDFRATDGFQPTQVECSELSGSLLDQGWVDLGTGTLLWDEALGLRGCYHTNDVRTIIVTDATTI
jgi:hypothetical protein